MANYLRTSLAALILLLALPVAAQVGDISTSTTVNRGGRADNSTATTNRTTVRRAPTGTVSNRTRTTRPQPRRRTNPNYCPPGGNRRQTWNQPNRRPTRRTTVYGNSRSNRNDNGRSWTRSTNRPTTRTATRRDYGADRRGTVSRPSAGDGGFLIIGKQKKDKSGN